MGRKTYHDLNDLISDLDHESILGDDGESLSEEDLAILSQRPPQPPATPQKPQKRKKRKPK